MVIEADREFVLHELNTYGRARLDSGKEEEARAIARAVNAVEAGADEVFVERTMYRVVED